MIIHVTFFFLDFCFSLLLFFFFFSPIFLFFFFFLFIFLFIFFFFCFISFYFLLFFFLFSPFLIFFFFFFFSLRFWFFFWRYIFLFFFFCFFFCFWFFFFFSFFVFFVFSFFFFFVCLISFRFSFFGVLFMPGSDVVLLIWWRSAHSVLPLQVSMCGVLLLIRTSGHDDRLISILFFFFSIFFSLFWDLSVCFLVLFSFLVYFLIFWWFFFFVFFRFFLNFIPVPSFTILLSFHYALSPIIPFVPASIIALNFRRWLWISRVCICGDSFLFSVLHFHSISWSLTICLLPQFTVVHSNWWFYLGLPRWFFCRKLGIFMVAAPTNYYITLLYFFIFFLLSGFRPVFLSKYQPLGAASGFVQMGQLAFFVSCDY